jgi:hypothetical protein
MMDNIWYNKQLENISTLRQIGSRSKNNKIKLNRIADDYYKITASIAIFETLTNKEVK